MPATQSLTLRGVAIMVIAYILQVLDITVESHVIPQAVDGISACVFLIGTLITAYGRWRAKTKITRIF